MKKTLLVFSLFFTTAAFGQGIGGYINAQPQFYEAPTHPLHASYAPIASEQTLMGGTSYTMTQGDRPAWDFPQAPQIALGDVARELKKKHEQDKKSRVLYEN